MVGVEFLMDKLNRAVSWIAIVTNLVVGVLILFIGNPHHAVSFIILAFVIFILKVVTSRDCQC